MFHTEHIYLFVLAMWNLELTISIHPKRFTFHVSITFKMCSFSLNLTIPEHLQKPNCLYNLHVFDKENLSSISENML